MDVETLVQLGDAQGVKLELVRGVGIWEALPTKRHQGAIFRIQSSIQPIPGLDDCGCVHYSDVLVRFAADTYKRPDIGIWCREPDEEDEAITLIPAAVIEIISLGYEAKDRESPPIYLAYGVQDVVLVDPRSGEVTHHRTDAVMTHRIPVTLDLACGCRVSI
jgi:Uma2 family endonuclease